MLWIYIFRYAVNILVWSLTGGFTHLFLSLEKNTADNQIKPLKDGAAACVSPRLLGLGHLLLSLVGATAEGSEACLQSS